MHLRKVPSGRTELNWTQADLVTRRIIGQRTHEVDWLRFANCGSVQFSSSAVNTRWLSFGAIVTECKNHPRSVISRQIGNESVRKIIISDTIGLFFRKLQSAFWQFQAIAVSECWCLTKLLPYILFEKYNLYFSIGNGQPREPALCQLYRHTFVPCCL